MWSERHRLDKCQSCGRNSIPHKGHGLCKTCFEQSKGYVWQKEYNQKHKPRIAQVGKEWAKAHPSSMRRSRRKWRDKHPEAGRKYLKTWRKNNKAPFCIVCGEARIAEWSHIIPCSQNGPTAPWNLIPLCPTHHRCFDLKLLNEEEFQIVSPYIKEAQEQFSKIK